MHCFAQHKQICFHTTERSTTLQETYEPIKQVMEQIKYLDHIWVICVDLQIINFLMGQQSGYRKFTYFLSLWSSRANDQNYVKK